MKQPSFYSLRFHLILLVIIALIPALGLQLHAMWEQRQNTLAEVGANAFRLADLAGREEGRLIEGARETLISISQFVRFHYNEPEQCRTFMASLLKQYQRYSNLGAVKPDGALLFSAVPRRNLAEAIHPLLVRHVIDTRDFVIMDTRFGGGTEQSSVIAAYPVIDNNERVSMAVFVLFDPYWFNYFEFDLETHLPEKSMLTMIDSEGFILAHYPNPENWIGQPIPNPELLQTILRQRKGVVALPDSDGIRWLHGYTTVLTSLKSRPVYLVLSIPKEFAFADLDRRLIRNLIGIGIVALLAIIAAWLGGDFFVLRKINAIAEAARRLRDGDLTSRTGLPDRGGELNQLSHAFNEMASELERKESQRQAAVDQLEVSREELRSLSLHLQTAIEQERTRIAREIHDILGQELTALKMDLSWLANKLTKEEALLLGKSKSMAALIDRTIEDVQRISSELRPGLLDDLGLTAAIEWQAEEFQKRTGIHCVVNYNPEDIVLGKELSTTIFRIFQEALTNIMRHANATEVSVRLEQQPDEIMLDVMDNGKGIPEARVSDHNSLGLIGIRERVRFWRGQVDITGWPNKGTRVSVRIPLDMREEAYDKDTDSR
jgi:signal transduction histidine kinase